VPNVNAPKNWNSQDSLVMLPTTEEKKRSELIDELMRIDEPLIAWAVITASPCYFTSGHLSLEYRDPAYSAWAKILMDLKQKPRLLAVAKQIGIEAHIFVITARGSKAGPANPDELAGGFLYSY